MFPTRHAQVMSDGDAVRVVSQRLNGHQDRAHPAPSTAERPIARANYTASGRPSPPSSYGSSVGETGFEPATARPPAGCATRLRHSPQCFSRAYPNWLSNLGSEGKRATGIEPALEAWKASVQPQHFARGQAHRTVPTSL
jgi:hypothetical protein